MELFKQMIEVDTYAGKTTYVNITDQVRTCVKASGIQSGVAFVLTAHTTCSVFYEEFSHDRTEEGDEFLQEDLNNVLAKIIPPHVDASTYLYPGEEHYREVESWPDAKAYLPDGDRSVLWNGDAHLKATLIGASVTLDIEANDLTIGATGSVYFADFDTMRERRRKCKVIVLG